MRLKRSVLTVALAMLLASALAQLGLVVDGRDLPGVTSSLVPGSSYAPAGELSVAVGAEMYVDQVGERVILSLGGRFLTLPVTDTTGDALGAMGQLDGTARATGAAVRSGVDIYLPVKGVIEAFGGTVAYLQAENRVVGVLPRAEVLAASLERVGPTDRLRIRMSAPVPYSTFRNDSLATAQLRFARSSLSFAETLEGDAIIRADLIPGRGMVDLRLQFAPGTQFSMSTLPAGSGFELIVEARAEGTAPVTESRPIVAVDPGHGGEDAGVRFADGRLESDLTWEFSERLITGLASRGVQVVPTRERNEPLSIASRSSAGVGADLFVSLHAAELPAGQFRLYFLGEAETTSDMDYAIRQNAAAETGPGESSAGSGEGLTASVRRRILLELVPDLEAGRRFAAALDNELFQLGGYRSAETRAAPLAVLAGAAGRGLLIEFSPADLTSETLPDVLAAALASVLGSGGFE